QRLSFMSNQRKTENPTGAGIKPGLRMAFDSRLKLEFHGSKITSDAGLLAYREGRAPFPEDRLSDGGSGGAERVVPDYFGTDWTVEITSSSNRMRKSGRNHMKTTATTEVVSSPPEENEFWN